MWSKSTPRVDTPQKSTSKPSRVPVKSTYLLTKPADNKPNNVMTPRELQTASKPPANIQEMVERIRITRPVEKEKRDKPNFWWNDDGSDSDSYESEFNEDSSVQEVEPSKNQPKENRLTKSKIFNDHLNKLDLKTAQLIDRSESTLNEKYVSSEGVGSSTSTTTTTTMTRTSELAFKQNTEHYNQELTFKPEFVKYLENKEKPLNYKANDDVLNQWRLRRKLETSRANAASARLNEENRVEYQQLLINENFSNTSNIPSSQQQPYLNNLQSNFFNQQTNPAILRQQSPRQQQEQRSVPTPRQQQQQQQQQQSKINSNEISTQTVSDTAVQTSIEISPTLVEQPKTHHHHRQKQQQLFNIEDTEELPTRDIDVNKNKSKKHPNNKKSTLLSPIAKTNHIPHQHQPHQTTRSIMTNDKSSELTKVSSIFDSVRNQSQFVSSSVRSSLNVNQPPIAATQEGQQKYSSSPNNTDLQLLEPFVEETIDYESDEILRILFKKLFFYQAKLK